MLKNHLTLAFRQLRRRKGFTLINLTGLSIGLAACVLIMLFVYHERSMDGFHVNKERIYRITEEHIFEGRLASSYFPLQNQLGEAFPQIDAIARLYPAQGIVQLQSNERFNESRIFYADPEFFSIFSFPLSQGNTVDFTAPNTAIVSRALASKYFGELNPVGQVILYENLLTHEDEEGTKQLKIVGVLEEIPVTSHIQVDLLISMPTLGSVQQWEKYGWHFPHVYTYLSLNDRLAVEEVEKGASKFLAAGTNGNETDRRSFRLQPLADIHLRSGMHNEIHKTGNERVVEVFSLAAVFILFLAIFNYVNLTTARSVNRAREVGVKKTLGASRNVLVRQFLTESFLLVFLSAAIAFTIVQVSLPWFSGVFGVPMQVTTLLSPAFILLFISGNILVSLLAGFYPSFVLSSFQPANVIRGKLLMSHRGIWLRRILVVAQFTIAVALMAGTALVYKQLQYINNKELGFQKENTLVININFLEFASKAKVLKESLLEKSTVKDVTFISNIIGTNDRVFAYPIHYEGNKEGQELELNIIAADVRTDDFFNLQMAEGRFFSEDFPADIKNGVVINEAAARLIGWDEPLNKSLTIKYLNQGQHHEGRVIGVVKDFHMKSLHHEIEPLAMVATSDPTQSYFYNLMLVKTQTGNSPSEIMSSTTEIWENLESGKPLEAYFLDDRINQLYEQENRTARMFSVFAVISVLISCLGLYGMSAYTAEIRRKEVCIRKIMGASVAGIVGKLSQGYLVLIGLAGALGSFIAWRFGASWLQGFAYKADLNVWIYLLPILLVLLVSGFTMISEILKIARINPAENLRSE